MFDVGDLAVLTFGNCVMCINDRGDQVVFETTHARFFSKLKKTRLFTFFLVAAHFFSGIEYRMHITGN